MNKINNNNCIAIQPAPIPVPITSTVQQQQQQQQTQYANILPLTTPTVENNSKNVTLVLPSASNSGNATVQQLISSLPSTTTNNKPLKSIEEMTMNELKEECRRRKLNVSGNKPKLIERIKASQQTAAFQVVKSPDSGVGNMEYSPSFTSCKQTLLINLSLLNIIHFIAVLGDHSPGSVTSINFNVNSRPPSVSVNNLIDNNNISSTNNHVKLSNGFSKSFSIL